MSDNKTLSTGAAIVQYPGHPDLQAAYEECERTHTGVNPCLTIAYLTAREQFHDLLYKHKFISWKERSVEISRTNELMQMHERRAQISAMFGTKLGESS